MLHDVEIRRYATRLSMIVPFVDYDTESQTGKISYGLTSCGYDIRLADEFGVVVSAEGAYAVDPKAKGRLHKWKKTQPFTIEPGHMILGKSLEKIQMPRELSAALLTKSTLARCGITLNTTPIEPAWIGYITLEIANISEKPVVLYPYEGIGQLQFTRLEGPCVRSYADKDGKYQNQKGVTGPIVR